ncbi:MAG: class I SAM-dependent methyltransferase [Desulfurivibrionaceae bacterium]
MDNFYEQFASRFRGSREDIEKRQAVYLPLLASLRALFPDGALLDLGCGRGEWLELASAAGWRAIGVDADAGMLKHAAASGLDVRQGEVLGFLRELPDASFSAVTGFHLAEHLPFDELRDFVRETHRILQPGGILILETPNPENLTVGACSFYSDPTHRVPLTPELLHFLVAGSGFPECRILRLNELPVGKLPADFSLVGVLYGVSPDFAVIGQKGIDPSFSAALAWPSEAMGGSLLQMAASFDQGLHLRLDGMQASLALQANLGEELKGRQQVSHAFLAAQISRVEDLVRISRQESHTALAGQISRVEDLVRISRQESDTALAGQISRVEDLVSVSRQESDTALAVQISRVEELVRISRQESDTALAGQISRVEDLVRLYQQELQAVYASRSWRYTAPSRWLGAWVRTLLKILKKLCIEIGRPSVLPRSIMLWGNDHCPWLKGKAQWFLDRHPQLKGRLKRWLREDNRPEESPRVNQPVTEGDLSPQTARIMADILHEQEQRKKGDKDKEAELSGPEKDG